MVEGPFVIHKAPSCRFPDDQLLSWKLFILISLPKHHLPQKTQ